MPYPNAGYWSALCDGRRIPVDGAEYILSLADCGELALPTGKLLACDPFTFMQPAGNLAIEVPPGRYRVIVTAADCSGVGDGSEMREAYATVLLDEAAAEISRRIITPLPEGTCPPEAAEDGSFFGFRVESAAACFVDAGALEAGMPAGNWVREVFDTGAPGSWFARMDDFNHIHYGLANVPLPLATDGANIVLIHAGWGHGYYPIVGGYDAAGRLVRVHIDFLVVV